MRRAALLFAIAAPCFASIAFAATARPTKIDPNIDRVIATGIVGPVHFADPVPGHATVLIELAAPPTSATIARLAAAGVELASPEGTPLTYDRFVPADVDAKSVAALSAMPDVVRVTLASGAGPLPLDQSAKLLRLADARGARPDLDELTGKGVTIGDCDSLVDPFQPTFFRGDAGYFDWIDTDGDGVLTPGVDAIDLDGDGKASKDEIAVLLRANTRSGGMDVDARPDGFDPSIDWLYLDTNGNGQRDYGAANGFDDTTPAFGEPLFVPDDVNRNGKLDVGEKVVRLGTSKFKKIYVHLAYQKMVDHVFTRGTDLATSKVDYYGGKLYGYADALHATGVSTILAGDVPLVGRRWVGMAPDADLVLAWDLEDSSPGLPVKGMTWALGEKPDVMLYELAPWTGAPLDGTDAMSALIDSSATMDDVAHTCPTGDQGSAHKHATATVAAGDSKSFTFDLPAMDAAGKGPLSYVELSFNVLGGEPTAAKLTGPNGDSYDLAAKSFGKLMSGASYYATGQVTPRNTFFYNVILYSQNAPPLDVGSWTVTLSGSTTAMTVHAYIQDDKSSWAIGAGWLDPKPTDDATIGIPSVADHCIAINASPDHVSADDEPWFHMTYAPYYDVPDGYVDAQGSLRPYSPRGPRIDGTQKPDVTAPDNPWVAECNPPGAPNAYGSFMVFSGTSGASPHVTGTAALLAQAGVKGDMIKDALRSGAIVDSATGKVPNADFGYGRLSAAGAFGVAKSGVDPTVTLAFSPEAPMPGDMVTLTPTAKSSDGSKLEAKWDDDYDGTWDTSYGPVAPRTVTRKDVGTRSFKVRVRNGAGHVAEAIAVVPFGLMSTMSTTPTDNPAPSSPEAKSGCGCRLHDEREASSRSALALLALLGVAFATRRRRR